ncbi:MAG: dockerin type I domain-containing protein [Oscillospiraceae bacterium]
MLRRRILASAMASVMALTSVAVVASADDTATDVKNVKTKADLEAYVKSLDTLRTTGIYDYGTQSGTNLLDAFEYAENVLAEAEPTDFQTTAAYRMLESVVNNLVIHSASDLQALINDCTKTYNSDNIMNEGVQDAIFTEDSFDAFVVAYGKAQTYVTSSESRDITDAYEELLAAKNGLVKLATVSKAEFRSIMRTYENLISKSKDYDTWRRGNSSGWLTLASGADYWRVTNTVTFGNIVNIAIGDGNLVDQWGNSTLIIKHDDATVREYITNAYERLSGFSSSATSDADILAAYTAAQEAIQIMGSWKADNTDRASKSQVTALLNEYHGKLVALLKTTAAEDLYKLVNNTDTVPNWISKNQWGNITGASLKNDGAKTTITVTTEGGKKYYDAAGAETINVGRNIDLLQYIKVTSADGAWGNLKDAMQLAEEYAEGNYAGIQQINEGTITGEPSGSAAEWTLVYRFLKYALEDTFAVADAVTTYKKSDVVALINEAYDLADKTGDIATFKTLLGNLAEARQAATKWVAAANADKLYKDGNAVEVDGVATNATATYEALNEKVKALKDELKNYAYSYGEIHDQINTVAAAVDAGELEASDALVKALADTAYALSTISTYTNEDSPAFSSDRVLQATNRLYTADGANGQEKALKAAYEALLAEVKKQGEVTVVLGDVDGNGTVNALDAAAILKAVVSGTEIDKAVGDVNADGAVNALDAAKILADVVAG